jgi:hypothetical protein
MTKHSKRIAAPHFVTAQTAAQNLWSVTLIPLSTIEHIGAMAEAEQKPVIPTPEKVLRDLAKNASKVIPQFEEKEPVTGVK